MTTTRSRSRSWLFLPSALCALFLLASIGHAQTPQITLIDAGAEPHVPLRYDVQSFSAGEMYMRMEMHMAMEGMVGSQATQLPDTIMRFEVSSIDFLGDNQVRLHMHLDEMRVSERPDVPAEVVTAMRTALAGMGRMSGSIVVDDRGVLHESDFDFSDASPELQQQLQSVNESMQQSSIPLPEEPVGIGARWQVGMSVESGGISIAQTANYRLLSRDDESANFEVSIAQTAPRQQIEDPTIPPGMTTYIDELTSEGAGAMTIRFADYVPTSTLAMTTQMKMSMQQGDTDPVPLMEMTLRMTIHISDSAE